MSQSSPLPRVSLGLADSEQAPNSSLWSQAACAALGAPRILDLPAPRGLWVAQAFGGTWTSPQLTHRGSTGNSIAEQPGRGESQVGPALSAYFPACLPPQQCAPLPCPQHESSW